MVTKTLVARIDQLQPGDHISYKRKLGYKHHAICVSVNKENHTYSIIHYIGGLSQCSKCKSSGVGTGASVIQTQENFPSRYPMYRYNHQNPFDRPEVINRAYQMLIHSRERYNLLRNNCEHFANYCKIGDFKSRQADSARKKCSCLKLS